jgi:hypothetical protein
MPQRLLLLEVVAKGGLGCVLLIAPLIFARTVGLPRSSDPFWIRLCGGLLLGVAAAGFLQGQASAAARAASGLGLGGFMVLNLALTATVFATLILQPPPARRGRLLLWMSAAALLLTALVELAYV